MASIDDKLQPVPCNWHSLFGKAKISYCGQAEYAKQHGEVVETCPFRSKHLFRAYDVNMWPKSQMLYRCYQK